MALNSGWIHIAEVEGSGSKNYHVARQMGGDVTHLQWGCDCPAWTKGFKATAGERKDCKHIVWVKQAIIGKPITNREITLHEGTKYPEATPIIAAFRIASKLGQRVH